MYGGKQGSGNMQLKWVGSHWEARKEGACGKQGSQDGKNCKMGKQFTALHNILPK